MAMYYFEIEPMLTQPLGEYEYLVIAKVTNGKTKEEKERYMKQQECLKLLRSGYVNTHNRSIRVDNIFDSIVNILNDFNKYYIFRIKHIANKHDFRCDYVSEFQVEKEFKSIEELIQDIDGKYIISDLYNKLISDLSRTKDGYATFHDIIKIVIDNQVNKVSLFDIMRNSLNTSDAIVADNIVLDMFKNEIILMKDKYETANEILRRLLENKLFKSALYFVQTFADEINEVSPVNANLLRNNSDSPDVMSILDILKLKIPGIVLEVIKVSSSEDGYGRDIETTLESKSFKNLDDIKTYIIRNYNVSYSSLQGNINDMEICDTEDEYIKFKIND